MSRSVAVILSLVLALVMGLAGCSTASPPAPVPAQPVSPQTPTPVPMPTPVFTNSGTSSTAELETKIRQLEAENQRLLQENQELKNKLESVQSEIPNLLIMVTQIQDDASQMAAFLQGLPTLPDPPPGLDDISKINNAVSKAVYIREILKKLPPPPPLAPTEWKQLDEMKDDLIDMTEWMEDLEEIPEFLKIAGDLDDLRDQEITHLKNISAIMGNIKSIFERIQE